MVLQVFPVCRQNTTNREGIADISSFCTRIIFLHLLELAGTLVQQYTYNRISPDYWHYSCWWSFWAMGGGGWPGHPARPVPPWLCWQTHPAAHEVVQPHPAPPSLGSVHGCPGYSQENMMNIYRTIVIYYSNMDIIINIKQTSKKCWLAFFWEHHQTRSGLMFKFSYL